MHRLWSIILISFLINVYGAAEPQEPLPFNIFASQEITSGAAAQATCLVHGNPGYGSGVLFTLDGKVAVLTSAHIQNPREVNFLTNGDVLKCDVLRAIPMEEDPRRLASQTDLKILFVSGNPEEHVRPLPLSSQIDPSTPLTVYGLGKICAEFTRGHLSAATPTHGGAATLSKVNAPTFTIDPQASALNYAGSALIRLYNNTFGLTHSSTPTIINPISSRMEGLIQITTTYDPTSLQTHIGEGFSGGPALQDDKIVGICQSSSLNINNRTLPESMKIFKIPNLVMWTSYFLGTKLPILQSIAPWLVDPIFSPSLRFALEKFGYRWLSSPLRMCIFNTASTLLCSLAGKAGAAYENSNYALRKPKKAWFVRLTPDVIHWIQSKLAESSSKLNTAS